MTDKILNIWCNNSLEACILKFSIVNVLGAQSSYKMMRPYLWENKGHIQTQEAGTKFEYKDRFFLLDFPEEGAEEQRGVQDGPAAIRWRKWSKNAKGMPKSLKFVWKNSFEAYKSPIFVSIQHVLS